MDYATYMEKVKIADSKMKESNGHNFVTMLKTRCTRCGRSPKQKGKCAFWLNEFVDALYHEIKQTP
jgi:hypothetical protein